MTQTEALRLALEALEVANSCVDGYYIPKGKTHLPEIEEAITAIKEALANEALEKMAENARELGLDYEPPQEAVAWRAWVSKFPQGTGSDWVYVTKPIMKDSIHNQPLYTTPPQRIEQEPEQEPVAWLDPWTRNNVTTDYDAYGNNGIPLYAAPPQRTEPISLQCAHCQVTIETLNDKVMHLLAQRTWVGLTDEEMHECAGEYPWTPTGLKHARTIEAKLKQKNGFTEEKNT